MAGFKVIKVLEIGKGQKMEILMNESEPEDSLDRYAVDTFSTGEQILEVPSHWHKNHQERFTVIEGRLEITLNGKKLILKADDEPLIIPRRAVHAFKAFKDEKLVFREQTDPPGLYKALFFNDLFSQGSFGLWHALRAFYDGDAYLALPLGLQIVDEMFLSLFGGLAHLFVRRKPETL